MEQLSNRWSVSTVLETKIKKWRRCANPKASLCFYTESLGVNHSDLSSGNASDMLIPPAGRVSVEPDWRKMWLTHSFPLLTPVQNFSKKKSTKSSLVHFGFLKPFKEHLIIKKFAVYNWYHKTKPKEFFY